MSVIEMGKVVWVVKGRRGKQRDEEEIAAMNRGVCSLGLGGHTARSRPAKRKTRLLGAMKRLANASLSWLVLFDRYLRAFGFNVPVCVSRRESRSSAFSYTRIACFDVSVSQMLSISSSLRNHRNGAACSPWQHRSYTLYGAEQGGERAAGVPPGWTTL